MARIPATATSALVARVPELLRERSFRRYWTGQSVSLLGDQVTQIALPLVAVLLLDANAAQMGWLTAAGLVPSLLFSLHAGVLADRRGQRRRMMIATDLGRAVLIISLPAAYALGILQLPQVFVVAFAVGTCSVLFDVCNAALFVSLLPVDRYVQGNSLIHGSRALSAVSGPSIGGLLVQILAAPVALVADAMSYVVSARFLSRIAPTEPPTAEPVSGDLRAGITYIARTPVLRANLAAAITLNFFNFIFHALFVLYAATQLGLQPGVLGTVLGAGAVGALLGAFFTRRLTDRIGIGPAVVLGFVAFPAPLMLIPLAGGPTPLVLALLFLAEFASGFGLMVLDISSFSLIAAVVSPQLRSRVAGATRFLNYGIRPIGAVAGGWLGTTIGLRPSLWIATVGAVLGVLWLLPSPIPRMRSLDSPRQ